MDNNIKEKVKEFLSRYLTSDAITDDDNFFAKGLVNLVVCHAIGHVCRKRI